MKYIGFNPWDYDGSNGKRITTFIDNITKNDYDKIILFYQEEFEYWQLAEINKILDIVKEKNQRIQLLTAAYEYLVPTLRQEEIDIWYWRDYFIGKTYLDLYKLIQTKNNNQHKHHFITLINKPRVHRCHLIDLLAKYELIENNPVTWNQPNYYPINYNWQHWQPKKLVLDDWRDSPNVLPRQYSESLVQLVSETEADNTLIISEKTATPLLLKKPFLVASTKHFHKALAELKFELYTELFDYSFDELEDRHERFEAVVQNFVRLSKVPINELDMLYDLVKDKVEYNKRRAEEIAFDFENYPELAKTITKLAIYKGQVIDRCHPSTEFNLRRLISKIS